MDLFAYGTLLEPRVLERVVGTRRNGVPARLPGFRRYLFADACYPGIVPDPQAVVEGVVYSAFDDADWEKLDEFESEMYERVVVTVFETSGARRDVYTYVVSPQYRSRLSDRDWDYDYFRRVHLARYVDAE